MNDGPTARDDVEQGRAVLAQAVAASREVLNERLVAAYALGSLAHGGFSALVSDIDLGLIMTDPLRPSDPETLGAMVERVKIQGPLHERLSVFWGTASSLQPDQTGGRFPALDRLDLIENGRLLYEEMRARISPGRPPTSYWSTAPSSRSVIWELTRSPKRSADQSCCSAEGCAG